MKISIIIPVLNEAEQIEDCLDRLQVLRNNGHEIIVVDGGSHDGTVQFATSLCDQLITSGKSRSIQMNTGARHSSGDCYLFLHADTYLPDDISYLIKICESNPESWGRFDVRLSGRHWLFRIIETCMNLRSRMTGISTGDQAIFVSRILFKKVGGFPELALMEDIAICKLLNNISKPVFIKSCVISSSRRWETHGVIKTILKMWMLRLLYFFNYDTNKLAELYK